MATEMKIAKGTLDGIWKEAEGKLRCLEQLGVAKLKKGTLLRKRRIREGPRKGAKKTLVVPKFRGDAKKKNIRRNGNVRLEPVPNTCWTSQ